MNLSPRSVRSRLTLWYVIALSALLVSYAAGALFVLFLNMREQLDHNLLEDIETVKEQIKAERNGSVALQLHHGDEGDPGLHRLVEIWSSEGSLLYRTPQLQGQALGATPISGEGTGRLRPASLRLPNGLRVRVASSVYLAGGRRVILRVANNEQSLWRELREFATVLTIGLPIGVLLAGFGGYALARKALAPIDAMAEQAQTISAERLSDRLSIGNPEDELGKLATVFNAMLARLQGAFDQLRRFTADASHELRTPLTAIRSVGEVALQDHKSQSEYRDVIGSMLEEVDRLTRLVESLLALSRADAGHIQLQCVHRSLLTLALDARSLVEVLAEEKHQIIHVECQADLIVSADRLILRQAIVNLLDNAIKYSPVGSRIILRVARAADNRATLDVIDQGPGIPLEHQAYVFDRFYRVDKARTREWGGTGLGLSITRWAVEAHGGKVTVLSREEGGSKFRISLPLIATNPSSNVTAGGAQ
jgi:heavy metal sensor kinase